LGAKTNIKMKNITVVGNNTFKYEEKHKNTREKNSQPHMEEEFNTRRRSKLRPNNKSLSSILGKEYYVLETTRVYSRNKNISSENNPRLLREQEYCI
jgi:hypothetical protein